MRTLSLALLFLVPVFDCRPPTADRLDVGQIGNSLCQETSPLDLCRGGRQSVGGGHPPLTVEDAVTLAIRQKPRLSAAARDVAAARSGVRSAQALANPALTFTPAFSPGGSDEELLLQQPLEPGTRRRRRGARPQ